MYAHACQWLLNLIYNYRKICYQQTDIIRRNYKKFHLGSKIQYKNCSEFSLDIIIFENFFGIKASSVVTTVYNVEISHLLVEW